MVENYAVTKDNYDLHEGAYTVGYYAAKVFTFRNEIAQNPYTINTRYWYSFNEGARHYLVSTFSFTT